MKGLAFVMQSNVICVNDFRQQDNYSDVQNCKLQYLSTGRIS